MRPLVAFALICAAGSACRNAPTELDPPAPRTPIRIAIRAVRGDVSGLSTLSYGGGFETKTWLYETLVGRSDDGRIVPRLAESWELEDTRTRVRFRIRANAEFHDGSACDAVAVRDHFERWIGRQEHAWLGAGNAIETVEAMDDRTVQVKLSRPYALLPDLCAMNPCAIVAPSAFDASGAFMRPIGTGSFQYVSTSEDGRMHVYERITDGQKLELVRCATDGETLDALLHDEIDVLADGWIGQIPRERIQTLANDPRFVVEEAAGSWVVYASFNFRPGSPTAEVSVRRRIAAAVDRADLCRTAQFGYAEPCDSWGAPTIRSWPRARAEDLSIGQSAEERAGAHASTALRLLLEAGHRTEPIGIHLANQLRHAGFEVHVQREDRATMRAAVDAGEFDLRIEESWGLPYDPMLSLRARFLPPPEAPTAATFQHTGLHPRLIALIERASATPVQTDRYPIFGQIQALLSREALIVPLLVPSRVAVMRRGIESVRLGSDPYRLDIANEAIGGAGR